MENREGLKPYSPSACFAQGARRMEQNNRQRLTLNARQRAMRAAYQDASSDILNNETIALLQRTIETLRSSSAVCLAQITPECPELTRC